MTLLVHVVGECHTIQSLGTTSSLSSRLSWFHICELAEEFRGAVESQILVSL